MDDDLDQLLMRLKLDRIREILPGELERAIAQKMSHKALLARLLREEFQYQQQRAMNYRIKRAKIPEHWALHTFPFDRQPAVSKTQINQLAELDFIPRGTNLVFVGPTGVGKTGLASAILLRALENGYRGLFIKAQDLFDEMYTSLADHSSIRLVRRLRNLDLILVDEMGYLNLRSEQTNIFFKLMEERYVLKKPTIITTNLDYDDWYSFLGNKRMVAALLDRLRHRCHTVKIDGASLRTPSQ